MAAHEGIDRAVEVMQDVFMRLRAMGDEKKRSTKRWNFKNQFWKKAAVRLIEREIDPRSLVYYVCTFFADRSYIPCAFFGSDKILKAFIESYPSYRKTLALKVDLMERAVRTQLDMGHDLRDILLNLSLELGAVYRYGKACQQEMYDVAEVFRERAEFELSFRPEYFEVIGDWFPERTRQLCRSIVEQSTNS